MKIYDINYNGNYVIMSDIHGNYEAFKAIIEEVINTYGKTIDGFIFLGDYAGDYPNGREVVELMMELNKKHKCYMVRGNRETEMLKKFYECTKNNFKDGHINIEEAEKLTCWSINTSMGAVLVDACKMTKEQIEFLIQLPETLILKNQKQTILLKHKTPLTKEEIDLLLKENKETNIEFGEKEIIILTGHTHDIHDKKYGNIRHFNPGSVALTDTGLSLAYYGVLNHGKILSKSVAYDYHKTISELEKNSILFKKCGHWGISLRKSILTGINVTVLYANERNRLIEVFRNLDHKYAKKILESDKELAKELLQKLTIEERPFSIGRYGNTNPYGEHLEVNVYQDDEKDNINIIPKQIISDDIIQKEKLPVRNNLPIPNDLINEIAMDYINEYLEYAIYGSYYINKNRWR